MGGLIFISGERSSTERQALAEAIARIAPQRGSLRLVSLPEATLGVQTRGTEASICAGKDVAVVCHGYLALPEGTGGCSPRDASADPAKVIAQAWASTGPDCISDLDGEFSLIVLDRRVARLFACVSLSMTRPLFARTTHCEAILASEVRQTAGASRGWQLQSEVLIETLCFGGPVLDRERTQHPEVRRLIAPRLYEAQLTTKGAAAAGLRHTRDYWTPPPETAPDRATIAALPEYLAALITASLRSCPAPRAMALSGGHDSGTLWACAHRRSVGSSFKGYLLAHPGKSHDETDVVTALLKQTGSDATILDASAHRCSDFVDSHIRQLDRIPATATLHYMDIVGARASADGATHLAMGIGAEAWLLARTGYAADLLRRGRWWHVMADALQFEHYVGLREARARRVLRFLKSAAAPRGSTLARLRPQRPPAWLPPRWHPLLHEAQSTLHRVCAMEGYGRGERHLALRYYPLHGGVEALEQLGQHYGLELAAPLSQRRFAELGFSLPARCINLGRHPKGLLRLTATQALGGTRPPWASSPGVRHGPAFADDLRLVTDLGPPDRWASVSMGIVTPDWAQSVATAAASAGPLRSIDALIGYTERFLAK